MNRTLCVAIFLAAFLSFGCSPKQEPEDVPAPPTAPQQEPDSAKKVIEDYGERLVTSQDRARAAQASIDIREVQRVVQDYALNHDGAYPPSLGAIKSGLGGIDLSQFNYDPSNGAVSIKGR